MSFSWPYRQHPHPAYWGRDHCPGEVCVLDYDILNSLPRFCEEDYILTSYVAEVISTLTNLTYLFYAYHGISANRGRKDAFLRNLPYLGIASVGLGSAIFHASLKNYTQWCDDLSMLLATTTVLHRVFTYNTSLSTTISSGLLATLLIALFSTWHCLTDELTMHSIIFGLEICVIGIKTRSIIKHRISHPAIRHEVTKLCTWGAIIFVSGFAIWNVDNAICGNLRAWRRDVGMPWAFVLELHGWWHVFTGLGAYIFIALVEYLTGEEAGMPLGRRFAWPVNAIVDGDAGRDEIYGNGNGNGNAIGSANGMNHAMGNGHSNGSAENAAPKLGKRTNGFSNGHAAAAAAVAANGKVLPSANGKAITVNGKKEI